MDAKGEVREVQIEAVVIRAGGTRESLGVVSYWHKNPLRRAAWRIQNLMTSKEK